MILCVGVNSCWFRFGVRGLVVFGLLLYGYGCNWDYLVIGLVFYGWRLVEF